MKGLKTREYFFREGIHTVQDMVVGNPPLNSHKMAIMSAVLCFWAVQFLLPGPAAAVFTWFAIGSLDDYGAFKGDDET